MECINYIFSKNQLSKRPLYKICNKIGVISTPRDTILSELKVSKWYLYTIKTNNITLEKILKGYHFRNSIIVCYPDISWIVTIRISKNNKLVTTTTNKEDFLWDFDLNYNSNEHCIEFIKLLEFNEDDIQKFIEYNNKYNKEG